MKKQKKKVNGDGTIDWESWFYIAVHHFHYSEEQFFDSTLRRLDVLVKQHQRFNKTDK